MTTDDQPPDRNGYLTELARLERLIEEQTQLLAAHAARLHAIELRLGLVANQSTTRPFGQGRTPAQNEQAKEPHAPTQLPPSVPTGASEPVLPPQFSVTDDTTQTTHTTAPPSVTAPDADETFRHGEARRQATATTQTAHKYDSDRRATQDASATANVNPVAAGVSRAWGDLEARIACGASDFKTVSARHVHVEDGDVSVNRL